MGGPVSVVFSDIFIWEMAEDVVVPVKPIFCKRCWWHIHTQKKNVPKSQLITHRILLPVNYIQQKKSQLAMIRN